VEAQEVVQWEAESGDRGAELEGVLRAMPVVVVEEGWEALGALVGVGVGVGIGPFAERGLDEAPGLAIGLWGRGPGEAMFEAKGGDGVPQGVGAIAGAVGGVNAPSFDAVLVAESQGGVEEGDGTVGGFIGAKLGEGETGLRHAEAHPFCAKRTLQAAGAAMVVDSEVEVFPACTANVIMLPVAGDAMAGARNARELLDVEMEKIAGLLARVALDGRWRRELGEVETIAVEAAGGGRFAQSGGASDLGSPATSAGAGRARARPGKGGWFGGSIWDANCQRGNRLTPRRGSGRATCRRSVRSCRSPRPLARRVDGDRRCA